MATRNKLRLGKCEYDPESRTITSENQPPRVIGHVQAKLLQLFYQSPNQYFSNAQLQHHVWENRFIANTTIRTTVSYLRKSLNESPECKYIDSGRNKGYRFVAKVEEISKRRQLIKILPLTTIALLSMLLLYFTSVSTPPAIIPTIQTTLLGQELDATTNQQLLIFSHKPKNGKYWNLYSKQIDQEHYDRLTQGKFNDIKAVFSSDGTRIAFNRHDGDSCKIMLANVNRNNKSLSDLHAVFDCPKELLSVSIAWKDEQHLYLSYTNSMDSSYQVFSFDLNTLKTRAISFPPSNGNGDYYVSRSYESGNVIFLRNIMGARTEIWQYHSQSARSIKMASFPLVLGSVAWIESGRKLVIRTENGQLSSLDLSNGNVNVLFTANYPIYYPFSVDQHSIGFMRGALKVRDIVGIDPHGNIQNLINSSFNDYRPVYAQKSGDIAFVSNRSGAYQIWLHKKNGELVQLTKFSQNHKILDMSISPDGYFVAFTIDAKLHVINSHGSKLFSTSEKNVYKNPVFSYDGRTLFYSINSHGGWFIEELSLTDWKISSKQFEGYVVRPCRTSECFYYTKFNDEQLFKSLNNRVEASGIFLAKIRTPNQLAVIDDHIYYSNRGKEKPEIFDQNLVTRDNRRILTLPNADFSIKESPLQFISSISREPDTNLETIIIR